MHLQPIENPDEPRYACAARDMVLSRSDWLVPQFNGAPRLVKPILVYWLMAGAAKLTMPLGVDMATAFRLPSLLFGLLTVLSVYGLGRRLWTPRVGLLAGLILTTTYYFHETSREIVIDPLLTGLLTWSWFCFVVAVQSVQRDPARTPYLPLLGFYVALGLACLAKGPAPVAVFAVLPQVLYLAWERKQSQKEASAQAPSSAARAGLSKGELLSRGGLVWGVPLSLLVGFLWFGLLWPTEYRSHIGEFFKTQTLARGLGQVDHNEGLKAYPFLFYLLDIPGKFMPWALLIIPVCVYCISRRRAEQNASQASAKRMLWCAILVPGVLLGLAGSKRSLYALPLYPLLALAAAVAWEQVCLKADAATASRKVWKVLLYILVTAGCLAIPILDLLQRVGILPSVPLNGLLLWVCFLLPWSASLAVLWAYDVSPWKANPWKVSLQALLALAALTFAYEAAVRPVFEHRKGKLATYGTLGDIGVLEHAAPRPWVWFGGSANEAVWYLDRPVRRLKAFSSLRTGFFEKPDALLVVREKEFNARPEFKEAVRELQRLTLGKDAYVLVEADPARKPAASLFEGPVVSADGE